MNALIAAQLAKPMTHVVVTGYADGSVKRHETRSLGGAENWATAERRKVGKVLRERDTERSVQVVFVTVETL